MSTSIEDVGGVRYRIAKRGGWWIASLRCDCFLGPHWHDQERARTRSALVELLHRDRAAK